jgi:hypothetical protein
VIRHVAVASILFTFACGPDIMTQRDSSVPMPAQPTWAWGVRDTVSHYELDPAAQNPMLHQHVQTAIENTLQRDGWKKVDDPSQAAVLVTYHIGIKREAGYVTTTTTSGAPSPYWGGYGWGYYGAPSFSTSTTTPYEYTEGGLLVFVRDRASGKVAWQGLFKKEVTQTARVAPENVQRAVDDLLRDLK